MDAITECMCNPKQQPSYSINFTIAKQRDDLKKYCYTNNCLYIIGSFGLLCYCGFPDRDCPSNLKLYHTSRDTFEVMCKGLLKSKLDITRCFSLRSSFLSQRRVVLSMYYYHFILLQWTHCFLCIPSRSTKHH